MRIARTLFIVVVEVICLLLSSNHIFGAPVDPPAADQVASPAQVQQVFAPGPDEHSQAGSMDIRPTLEQLNDNGESTRKPKPAVVAPAVPDPEVAKQGVNAGNDGAQGIVTVTTAQILAQKEESSVASTEKPTSTETTTLRPTPAPAPKPPAKPSNQANSNVVTPKPPEGRQPKAQPVVSAEKPPPSGAQNNHETVEPTSEKATEESQAVVKVETESAAVVETEPAKGETEPPATPPSTTKTAAPSPTTPTPTAATPATSPDTPQTPDPIEATGAATSPKNLVIEQSSMSSSDNDKEKPTHSQSSNSHFMTYMISAGVVVAVVYLVYHNKHKLLGLLVEGRSYQRGGGRRNGARYRRLDRRINDDDNVPLRSPSADAKNGNVIY